MKIVEKDFNGYIGIKVVIETSYRNYPVGDPGNVTVPLTVLWCPKIGTDKGWYRPQWENLKDIPGNFNRTVSIPRVLIDGPNNVDEIHEHVHREVEFLIQDVMDHFCEIGKCRISSHVCPKAK